jgi:hypothetical protein
LARKLLFVHLSDAAPANLTGSEHEAFLAWLRTAVNDEFVGQARQTSGGVQRN